MERLGDEVRGALRSAGVPDAGVLALVTRAWPAAVGPAIARAAWPLRIARDGTMLVATESSTWANELSLLQDEIRSRLAEAVGPASPDRIRFAVGPVPAPGPDAGRPPPPPPPVVSAEVAETAAGVAAAIEDPELRELVRRAAAASLAARRSDRGL